MSRACRRGHHRYCRDGCECNCHIPGYDEDGPECKQCHTADPDVMRASPFPDFCGDACSHAYYEAIQAEMRARLSPEDAAALHAPADPAQAERIQAVGRAVIAEREGR